MFYIALFSHKDGREYVVFIDMDDKEEAEEEAEAYRRPNFDLELVGAEAVSGSDSHIPFERIMEKV